MVTRAKELKNYSKFLPSITPIIFKITLSSSRQFCKRCDQEIVNESAPRTFVAYNMVEFFYRTMKFKKKGGSYETTNGKIETKKGTTMKLANEQIEAFNDT